MAWNSTLKKLRSWRLVPSLHDKWKGKKWKQWHFLGLQITADGNCCHEIKRWLLLGRKAMTNLDSVLKSRYNTLLTKLNKVKSTVFPSSHVWMWELDRKEGWALKNWCFWIVVLEKTVESPLDSKENKPVNPKWNQPWIFIRSETGRKGSGHNFWKNNIARGYNINWLESNGSKRGDKSTLLLNQQAKWHDSFKHHQKTKNCVMAQLLEISTPSPKQLE